ncbi:MAG: glutamate 5-kinase, partial [Chloroflexota bacterium]
ESRKRWIFAGPTPAGTITLDYGEVQALRKHGRSLLPAGITAVDGEFERGDTVSILRPDYSELARGTTRYGSAELRQIIGCHSDEIVRRLGYAYGPVAVHRNDLILL